MKGCSGRRGTQAVTPRDGGDASVQCQQAGVSRVVWSLYLSTAVLYLTDEGSSEGKSL